MDHFLLGFSLAASLALGIEFYWHRTWVRKHVAAEIGKLKPSIEISKLKQFSVSELKAVEHNTAYEKCDWCAHLVARWTRREDGRIACLNCQHDHGV